MSLIPNKEVEIVEVIVQKQSEIQTLLPGLEAAA
jgi:hypothetical protein